MYFPAISIEYWTACRQLIYWNIFFLYLQVLWYFSYTTNNLFSMIMSYFYQSILFKENFYYRLHNCYAVSGSWSANNCCYFSMLVILLLHAQVYLFLSSPQAFILLLNKLENIRFFKNDSQLLLIKSSHFLWERRYLLIS